MRVWLFILCLITLAISPKLSAQPANASQSPTQTEKIVSSIRDVNFKNFAYPWPKDLIDSETRKKTFRLRNGGLPITRDKGGNINGGASLQKIVYGDVTGDGKEEAMLYVSLVSGGTGDSGIFYVYSLQNGKPILLWHFATGDRANEGFRRAYASKGHLVLELNHPFDKNGQNHGACCPTIYSRNTYIWEQNHFRLKWKRLFPISAKD